jgi:putative membrane protein
MSEPAILLNAEFNPRVKSYWTWQPVLFLTLFIVTIPIAILYAIIARFFIGRYLANLHCSLTERTLDIKKGIWNKTESTIPLEKITDLQLFQGPIMRYFEIHGFKVETAGQSPGAGGGALVNLVGIVDTKGFRKAVLDQRDRLSTGAGSASATATAQAPADVMGDPQTAQLLTEIRDSLQRIEQSVVAVTDPPTQE